MVKLRAVGDNDGENEKRGPGRPAAEDIDPWETDQGHQYSVDQFYTRSTNKFDHSNEVRVAIPKTIYAEIMELVDSKKFGAYRSAADVLRDATVHRLRTIAGWLQDEDLIRVLTLEERICRERAEEDEVNAIEEFLDQLTTSMKRHADNGDARRLAKKITDLEDWTFYLVSPHLERAQVLAQRYRLELKRVQDKG